jgi:hypothetical protein
MPMLHAAKYDWQVIAMRCNTRCHNKMAWLANNWERLLVAKAGDFAGMSQYATIKKSSDQRLFMLTPRLASPRPVT